MRNRLGGAAAFLMFLAAGCGPKAVPTEGIVTFDGKPVAGASVMFVPLQGPPASAITDEKGEFQLTTSGGHGAGALPGEYKVTVTLEATTKIDLDAPRIEGMPAQIIIPPSVDIPPDYSNPQKTPLSVRIPAEGKIELKVVSAAP
jgi:hypothetical protein